MAMLITVLIKYMMVSISKIGVSISTKLTNTRHPYIRDSGNQIMVPKTFAIIQAICYDSPLFMKCWMRLCKVNEIG